MSLPVEFGVFLPVGKGGFIPSTTIPDTPGTYEHNRRITVLAEELGLGFAIALARWRGFGGPSEHGSVALESVTTISGLAEATKHIRLFATMQTMAFHPAVAAKMIATMDQISGGRVGLNVVAGSNPVDHGQMGLWKGYEHDELYEVATEWITVAKLLWSQERTDFEGKYYRLVDCISDPKPVQKPHPPLLCAAVSDRGMRFTTEHADASLMNATGLEELKANGRRAKELAADMGGTTKTVGLAMVIPGETDAEARARVDLYNEGVDRVAVANREFEYSKGAREWSRDIQKQKELRRSFSPSGEPIAVTRSHIAGNPDTIAETLADVVSGGDFDWFALYLADFIGDLEIFGKEVLPKLVKMGIAKPPGTFSPLI